MKAIITQTELNQETLAAVISEAVAKASQAKKDSKRWINAIAKATVELESNPFMTYNHDSHSLTVLSPASGTVYEANGTCQCKAFELGQPCWHRAAAKLVVNYIERTR